MSTVQKIFVVIVFALSVVFTVLSLQVLAHEQKWKDQYSNLKQESEEIQADLREEIANKDDEIKALETTKTENTATIRELNDNNTNLSTTNKQLRRNLQTAEENATTLGENNKVLAKQNEDYKRELKNMTNKYRKEKKRAEDMVKIYQFKQDELADVIAELNDLKASYSTLQENYKKTAEEAQGFRMVLDQVKQIYDIDVAEMLAQPEMPEQPIEGKVVAVSKDKEGQIKLVMLSVGRQDGVELGYKFVVYRDDRYVGKVVVDKVFDDMATAHVDPESLNRDEKTGDTMQIKQYDSASTHVY